MSFLSGIGKLFKKIFAAIKKLLKWLGPLLIIIAIIIAIFFPYLIPVIMGWISAAWTAVATTVGGWISAGWGWLVSAGSTLLSNASSWVSEASFADVLKVATGAAVLLNPEGVAEGAGSIIGAIGEVVADVLGPSMPWIIIGLAAYLLLTRDKKEEQVVRLEQGGLYGDPDPS